MIRMTFHNDSSLCPVINKTLGSYEPLIIQQSCLSLKVLLIDCTDGASKTRHRLTDERLTTVMDASFKEGKIGPAARRRFLEEDTELLKHIADADEDTVLDKASRHIRLVVENRLVIVLSSLLTALKLEVREEIIAPLDIAAKCISDAFITVRD